MQPLLDSLLSAVRAGRPVAYTTLVETRGSTPQKAGATMLVFADGSQAGTLGGGCVEAEVKRRALALLPEGQPQLLSFQLDHDYGWDDGLICGGRMLMLVDPVRPGEDLAYHERLGEYLRAGHGVTEGVVIHGESAATPEAARLLFDKHGTLIAARGASEASPAVRSQLRPLSERPRPYVAGGVSFLPHLPRCRLIIVGGGHVGCKVAELAAQVDFDVWVIDDREEYCNAGRFPTAKRLICGPMDDVLPRVEVDTDTFCIIVTRGHNHDETALFHLVNRPSRYLGMIGSKRKIRLIFDDLRREGISEEALSRVRAPLGLDIGSQTVPEIAVSIVAELIARRNVGDDAVPVL
jgi:xanthine dehydrogenase accessory factor